ncbi:MAG TPA: urate hydroxylase PuuD [Pyrinomonadaceae bacterium]|nr:urate hydroxylase PuuD [Pyrinomonadaceae bacterium]
MISLDPTLSEWLNLLFRWTHVFAGIMWVGTTYYFTWLDARLTEEEKAVANTGVVPQVWMVHSGGFYVVEKRKVPDLASRTLHWFRWEAATTWLSGFALLVLLYYLGGGVLVDPDVRDISVGTAVALGLTVIVGCGVLYDAMMMSPLGRHEKVFAVVGYVLIVALSFGLTRVFSGRAAYIHLGAIFGTIMAANVWMHILPAQKRMIAALNEGRKPDERLSVQAKLRSKQNTFLAVPVVFIMISNHFPGVTYGERYNWIILSVLVLVGWIAAKFIRRA